MVARGPFGRSPDPAARPVREGGGHRPLGTGSPAAPAPSISLPTVSLPTGGGAIRGIGEKFAANPATGTGAFSVPLATSPGRSGFGPELALSYDTGLGNGGYGFGWSLSLPSVTRRTDQGLPRYDDAAESDAFLISGAEDLVPVRDLETGEPIGRTESGYRVERYRPRIEGLFARIERWTRLADGDVHWRSVSRDNLTTWYGADSAARIADPEDPRRVFTWLVSRSYDDQGNVIMYEYLAENGDGVDLAAAHERHRSAAARTTNRHLKRIRYGNRVSRLVDPGLAGPGWMFEVVFDYGDHRAEAPTPAPDRPWPVRSDPFSSYRSGFEVRTYRLCRRVLMFHHFPDQPEVGPDCLVRSTAFGYAAGEAMGEFLTSVTQRGHRRVGEGYLTRSLPPLEFEYAPAILRDQVREVDPESVAGAPAGLAGDGYRWVDLDGEGISGILAEQAGRWFYKPNLGGGRFGPARLVAPVPSTVGAGESPTQLLDLAGDGQLDLVALDGPVPGFFRRREQAAGWHRFAGFDSLPTIDWNDPQLRFVDLDGDGHADLLVTEDQAFTWYPSRAEAGFGPAGRVAVPADEERGPRLVFADQTGSVHLADMSGDGLTDLVRIRNGEVCYWPNLGHGRFGAKVVMDDAPWFDRAELFDPRYLRVADVDGSGVVDLVYLGHDGARIYLNRSGNAWSPVRLIATAPRTDHRSQVATVDLFGTGTTCLVWSSDQAVDARRSLRYIDLLGSTKPHLLVRAVNNLGAETEFGYAPSTRFYLADRAAGRPWLTRLPFPVQVVERVVTVDRVSWNRFVTRYAYHHGHFDGTDREFRGFGMVEQWDTEELTAIGGEFDASNQDPASHVPPVLTRTWFHTGGSPGPGPGPTPGAGSGRFEAEYWREPGLTPEQQRALRLADTHPPEVLRRPDGTAVPHQPTAQELREAGRALKGLVLRQEVYADDGSEAASRPYQVTERSYTVELLQPRRAGDRFAVCSVHPRESVSYHYERALYLVERPDGPVRLADPRVSHEATLEVDGYGNVLRAVAVSYPRRHPDTDLDPRLPAWARDAIRAEQTQPRATLTVNGFTSPIDEGEHHRAPLPYESRSYELVRFGPAGEPETGPIRYPELRGLVEVACDGEHDLPYQDLDGTGATGPGPYRRLIEQSRTRYRRDDLSGPLPLGQAQPLGLPDQSYLLALTPGLVAEVYRRAALDGGEALLPDPATSLAAEGGYLADPDGWWVPSGQVRFSPDPGHNPAQELAHARTHFFLPSRMRDPFGNLTTVTYDQHDLMLRESRDPVGNRTTVEPDYRVLQPRQVTDPNRNRSAVVFDALGLVVGTAVMGRPGEPVGDSLDGFQPDLPPAAVTADLAEPLADPHATLGGATSRLVYDVFGYHRTRGNPNPRPAVVHLTARETHDRDLAPGQRTGVQHVFSYSDGFDREIQRKSLVEPGPVGEGGPDLAPRWVGSGWTIVNNKGNPVRVYEPFFSDTHQFEHDRAAGVSAVLGYDPLDRVVATLVPDDTFTKVTLDPWQEATWDGNDTVLLDPRTDPDVRGFLAGHLATRVGWQTWYAQRQAGALGDRERVAAGKTAIHAGTAAVGYADPLGRRVLTVAHNRYERVGPDGGPDGGPEVVDEGQVTRVVLDLEGNQREVVDPLGRVAAHYDYDLIGNRIHQRSMEAGERWILSDVGGNPIYQWDSRGHTLRSTYDQLRRPTGSLLQRAGGPPELVARTSYGESHPAAEARNLRGRVHQVFDAAGVLTNEEYDFKGNLLTVGRRLAVEYTADLDWSGEVPLEPAGYDSRTRYDARDRPVSMTGPDGTVVRLGYNQAELLERVEADLRGAATGTVFVANIDYDAKGQRTLIEYGNGVRTGYRYHPSTFRLSHLFTVRGTERLQDLAYTYDPAGNLLHIRDAAQQTRFFRNRRVDPDASYTYDAVYRLVEASGREHLGQSASGQPLPPTPASHHDAPRDGLLHPGDGAAMGRYLQRYDYDQVGNLLAMVHRGSDPADSGWTREYRYAEPSPLEPGRTSNRLTQTRVGQAIEPYSHDPHGNLTAMPHLPVMRWDHRDQLRAAARQVVNAGTPETTWYVYDAGGERVRKVTERQAPAGQRPTRRTERIYLGGFEVHREYAGDGATVTLERETLHLMTDTQRVALVETRTGGTDPGPEQLVRFQLSNHLGSATLELDDLARVISYAEYYPYGSISYQAVRDQSETPQRYRYTGKERDAESGLCYHRARYYAPWLGRWTSADPIGMTDGPNLYCYARSAPVRFRDPDGLLSKANEEFVKTARKHLDDRVTAVEGRITKIEKDVDARVAKDKAFLEARFKKQYAKEKPKGVGEDKYVADKLAEHRASELKSRGYEGQKKQLDRLKDLRTFYKTHKFSDDSLLLGNVVVNEAGVENQQSKEAIAYGWLNRTGGAVRAPTGAEISHYQELGERLKGKTTTGQDLFLEQLKESVLAADVRIADVGGTKDPTGGATHWISPKAKIFDKKSGGNIHKRTIDGKVRFVPDWARANNDPKLPKLKTGKDAILNKDYQEITVNDVGGFLFYKGVKF
jgi:RHS repeat-associated protein